MVYNTNNYISIFVRYKIILDKFILLIVITYFKYSKRETFRSNGK